jgi:nitrogen regulatory protein P-II 1
VNRIIAVIPRESLEAVRTALLALDAGGMTLSDIFEAARGIVREDEWWGLEQDGMLRVEVISLPETVDDMVCAITTWVKETARRPRGMIFVTPLEGVIRIRTQESDAAAIL